MLCLSHPCLIFPGNTWLPSRGLLLEVDGDACEGSKHLTTGRSRSISSDGGETQSRVPGLLLLRRRQKLRHNGLGQSQLQLPSGVPDRSHIFRGDREVLCHIQPAFHSSHSGLLVQSQPCATTALGRGDSALPQTHEMQKMRLGLGRGNMGVRRGIQGWQSL